MVLTLRDAIYKIMIFSCTAQKAAKTAILTVLSQKTEN